MLRAKPAGLMTVAFVLNVAFGASACAVEGDDAPSEQSDDALTGFKAQQVTVSMSYGETVYLDDLTGKAVTGVKFNGTAGDTIEAWVSVDAWGLVPGKPAALIGPNGTTELATADPSADFTRDARLRFTLTKSGTHYVAFRRRASDTTNIGAWIHLEKKGAGRAPLGAASSPDPCTSQPWPMAAQCRDLGYRSHFEGPLSGHVAWSKPYNWTRNEQIAGLAVGRDGTVHLLHGAYGIVLGYTMLVYSAIDANGDRTVSERLDLGRLHRASLALNADGTPYFFLPNGVADGVQQGMFRGSLFSLDNHGLATEVGAFQPPSATLVDNYEENTRMYPRPLLRIDEVGRPYVRVRKNLDQQAIDSTRYLGDIVRFDPATDAVSYVPGAASNEPPGYDGTEYALPAGQRVISRFRNIERRDASGAVLWTIWDGSLAGVDVAHDRLFTKVQVNAPPNSGTSGPWHRFNVHSLTTGKLLWSTTARRNIQRAPLLHKNGDIVFQAGKDTFDGSFEIWGLDGTQKGGVSLSDPPLDLSTTELALDDAGTTYAFQGNRFFAVDKNGATRIDLTIPVTSSSRCRVVIGANQTVYVVTPAEIVAIKP